MSSAQEEQERRIYIILAPPALTRTGLTHRALAILYLHPVNAIQQDYRGTHRHVLNADQ